MGGLKKKLGPFPRWVWLAVLVLALVYWWYRRRQNSAATVASGTVSSGASTNVVPVANTSGVQDMSGALSGQPSTASAPADSLSPDVLSALSAENSALVGALSQALGNAFAMGAGPYATSTGQPPASGPADASQPASTVSAPTATTPSTPSATATKVATPAQPFGGIVSKRKLANGATLTTYASGRQIEQAPGRSPYVVHA